MRGIAPALIEAVAIFILFLWLFTACALVFSAWCALLFATVVGGAFGWWLIRIWATSK